MFCKINIYLCLGCSTVVGNFLCHDERIKQIFWNNDLSEKSQAFDVFIKLERFPEIVYSRKHVVAEYSDLLLEYIFDCERFAAQHPRFFNSGRLCDGQANMLAKLYGKTRVTMPDLTLERYAQHVVLKTRFVKTVFLYHFNLLRRAPRLFYPSLIFYHPPRKKIVR